MNFILNFFALLSPVFLIVFILFIVKKSGSKRNDCSNCSYKDNNKYH